MLKEKAMKLFEKVIIKSALDTLSIDWETIVNSVDLNQQIYFTGAGYFLTLKSRSIPINRHVVSEPVFVGKLGNVDVGFIVIIENNELTLECYTYGETITAKDRDNKFRCTLEE
ncbi:TPA: hypothetical protein ACPJ12_004747 [Vibrio diabolicus]|uniref:hypothetical protein n=2 Tax=Vibrio diabolicus TaxID=50719 RepID=UPI00215EEF36|nr:hypothetical protein [Vibrio diabolicus]MCS0396905.1 hypothetical protein [Vibrio diabolicus]